MRVSAIVGGGGKIELGLNADLDALGLTGALRRARTSFRRLVGKRLFFLVKGDFFVERKTGLRIFRMKAAAPGAVVFQAAGDFAAPFGFAGIGIRGSGRGGRLRRDVALDGLAGRVRADELFGSGMAGARRGGGSDGNGLPGLIEIKRGVAERTLVGVLKYEGTTIPADFYHWSVLRCGSSSDGTEGV